MLSTHADAVDPQAAAHPIAYTVRAGETLVSIARRLWGEGERWQELYAANRDRLVSPNAVAVGTRLRVPTGQVPVQALAPTPGEGWLWELVREMGGRHHVAPQLLMAVIQYASRPEAQREGYMGVMLLPPATLRAMTIHHPLNPRQNVEGGARSLAFLLKYYNDRLPLALAAYHAGVGLVDRYAGLPPCESTRAWVLGVLAAYGESLPQTA